MELAGLIKVNNITGARLCGPNFTFISKKLALTNHFILLVSESEDFYMLHKSIDAVRLLDAVAERRYAASGQQGFTLVLFTKTFCIYELTVPTLNEARALHQSLEALCNVDNLRLHYPFFYKPTFPLVPNGSPIVSITDYHADALASGRWRLSQANKEFALCDSYPEEVVVPSEVVDSVVAESSAFRRGARFPILVYYHKPRKTALLLSSELVASQTAIGASSFLGSGGTGVVGASTAALKTNFGTGSPAHANATTTGSVLSQASALATTTAAAPQQLLSVMRCRADEQLLAAVLPDRYRGAILDLRDQSQTRKSQALIESEQNYPQWRRIHRPMETSGNLCVTFQKFIEVCTSVRSAVRNAPGSFGVMYSGSFSDSISVLAAAALGPSATPNSTTPALTSLGAGQFTREADNSGGGDRVGLSFDPVPAIVSALSPESETTEQQINNNISAGGGGGSGHQRLTTTGSNATTVATATVHSASNLRRVAAWLSAVREALAAAVAGATALDARDAFAQQQLQQEQCLLARKYKDSRREGSMVREEAKLRGSFVLVHSRKGLDRALLVSSLIRIILDPTSRTFNGFQNLVEHVWVHLGHPFSDRCRSAAFAPRTDKEQAPVFVLFMDCVWQLWRQYPTCFEFTDELLCILVNHAYCSEFGTFIGNCMKERVQLNVSDATTSLWSYLSQPSLRAHFTNPLYVGEDSSNGRVTENYACWPCLAPQALEVWQELYQRQLITDPESLWNRPRRLTRLIMDQFHAESKKVSELKSILTGLKDECIAAGLIPTH